MLTFGKPLSFQYIKNIFYRVSWYDRSTIRAESLHRLSTIALLQTTMVSQKFATVSQYTATVQLFGLASLTRSICALSRISSRLYSLSNLPFSYTVTSWSYREREKGIVGVNTTTSGGKGSKVFVQCCWTKYSTFVMINKDTLHDKYMTIYCCICYN